MLLPSTVGAVEQGKTEGAPTEVPRLGADSFAERERAELSLWERGQEATATLQEQAAGGDPEVSWRARQVLRWIDLRITPETPPQVVNLIEAYLQANTALERERLYNSLIAQEAYQQLFRLPDHISDEVVSKHLAERVAELAGQVAAELLVEDRDEEALEVLAGARREESSQLRWVALASAMGLRDELWKDLDSRDRMRFARWAGDVELVRELAPERHEVWTTLNLLDGNPIPFLEQLQLNGKSIGTRAQLAQARWEGRSDEEDIQELVAELQQKAGVGEAGEGHEAFQILAQSGYTEEALSVFERDLPAEAFDYFQQTERLDRALRSVGLKPGQKVSDRWIRQTVQLVKSDWDLENEGCKRAWFVASFSHERGQTSDAKRILEALLTHLDEEADEHESFALISLLAGNSGSVINPGIPELAIQIAAEREGEFYRPRPFLMSAFNDSNSVARAYDFVLEQKPDWDEWKQVRAVFGFFGREVDLPAEAMEEILLKFEAEAEEQEREQSWLVLQESASYRGDIQAFKRSVEALIELEGEDRDYSMELAGYYYSDRDFLSAGELWAELVELDPSDFTRLGFATVCLAEAGKQEEAQKFLNKIEKLSLGDGRWLVLLSELSLRVGDYERARSFDEKALLLLPSNGTSWFRQLSRLASSAQLAGHWKQAAACHQAYEAMRVFEVYPFPQYYLEGIAEMSYCLGMQALEDGDDEQMRAHFDRCVEAGGYSGFFADEVLWNLRGAGRFDEVARIWGKLGPTYRRSLELYPNSHNALNTAAWVAARAAVDVEQAGAWSDRALELRPQTSAYLDTKAETFFAQGNREKAVEWSDKACQYSRGVEELSQLKLQYRHFAEDSLFLPLDED